MFPPSCEWLDPLKVRFFEVFRRLCPAITSFDVSALPVLAHIDQSGMWSSARF
jgi:uncharacterized protein YggT (Ycf19 family)